MSLLDFGQQGGSPLGSKKSLKLILGIAALAGAIALGSTLAANISLNSGSPVEFGQGVAQATACDDRIVVTPQAPFINDAEESTFLFNQFSVTDISDTCFGKTFTIKVYKNGQNSPLDFYNTNGTIYTEIRVRDDSGSFSFVGGGLTSDDIQNITGGFHVTIGAGTLPSFSLISGPNVDRITIESAELAESAPVSYEVGDTGPGGGTVFYVDISSQGFSETGAACSPSCRYLEAAPTNPALLNYWTDEEYPWSGNTSESVGTTDESFGTGGMNTSQSINQPNGGDAAGNAVTVAHAYRGPHGMADWFLPSKVELTQMCKWQGGEDWVSNETPCTGGTLNSGIGATGFMGHSSCGYFSSCYWSSSEAGSDAAWFQLFNSGDQAVDYKTYLNHVRPIRAF